MTEVVFTFLTQEQADKAVLALSYGYKVVQYRMSTSNSIKPYCVRVSVPDVGHNSGGRK